MDLERENGRSLADCGGLPPASAASPPPSMGFFTDRKCCRCLQLGLFVIGLCTMVGFVVGLALPKLLIWTEGKCTVTAFTADDDGVCSSVTFRVEDTGQSVKVEDPLPTSMLQQRSCAPPTDLVGRAFTCFYDSGNDGSIGASDLCIQEKEPPPKDPTIVTFGYGLVAAMLHAWRPLAARTEI